MNVTFFWDPDDSFGRLLGGDLHLVGHELVAEAFVLAGRVGARVLAVTVGGDDLLPGDGDLVDLVGVQLLDERAERDDFLAGLEVR